MVLANPTNNAENLHECLVPAGCLFRKKPSPTFLGVYTNNFNKDEANISESQDKMNVRFVLSAQNCFYLGPTGIRPILCKATPFLMSPSVLTQLQHCTTGKRKRKKAQAVKTTPRIY
jgi:hypothetical protein